MASSFPSSEMVLGFRTNPTKVAYTGTAGRTAELAPGLYYLTSDQDCYIRQGGSTITATASSIPLWAGIYLLIQVSDSSDAYVSAVQVSTGGTIYAIPALAPAAR